MDEKLPTYDELPHEFTIMNRPRHAVVTVDTLKRHLKLLGAFHHLKQIVQSDEWLVRFNSIVDNGSAPQSSTVVLNNIADPAVRWSVFVAMSVYRLVLWINDVLHRDMEDTCVPPLDVALALHAYRLNPRKVSWYREDIMRRHPHLDRANDVLLGRVADSIDPMTLELHVSQEASDKWLAITNTPWDPFVHLATSPGRVTHLPSTNEIVTIPWMTESGTGWAQQSFQITDSRGQRLTHETFGIFKLIGDLRACQTRQNIYMASTVFAPADKGDGTTLARAARINKVLFRYGSPLRPILRESLVKAVGTTKYSARKALLEALQARSTPRGFNAMMSAYTRGEQFSLDLAAAILRQGTFVDKMASLGWLDPHRFEKDDGVLQRAVARYHAFLDLVSLSPSTFVVPTLDIDLAWHTHQLSPLQYKKHTISYLGRFLDHDDKVAEETLSNSFQQTARLWRQRFGVPYSICGCPLPEAPSAPLGVKLRRKLGLKPKPVVVNATGKTLLAGANCDHYALDDIDSTHPSEHPAVIVTSSGLRAHHAASLQQRARNQLNRDDWLHSRNELDPFLVKSRLSRRRYESATANGVTTTHTTAFLYPVPLAICYGADGYPVAAGGPDGVGCAATDGSIMGGDHCPVGVAGSGSCAVGAGMCAGDLGGGISSSLSGAGSCMASLSSGWGGGDFGGGFSSCGGGGGGGGCGGGGGSSS
ncbi:hypothetical protein ACM66B_004685 [Microbotryomycetes sp. NB124-2]